MASTYPPIVAPMVAGPNLAGDTWNHFGIPLLDPLLQNQQWDWVSLDLLSLAT